MILLQAVGAKQEVSLIPERWRASWPLSPHTQHLASLPEGLCETSSLFPSRLIFRCGLCWGECRSRSFAPRPPRSYQQADDVGFTKTQVRGRRQWINCAARETLFPVNISIPVCRGGVEYAKQLSGRGALKISTTTPGECCTGPLPLITDSQLWLQLLNHWLFAFANYRGD